MLNLGRQLFIPFYDKSDIENDKNRPDSENAKTENPATGP